MHFGDSVEGDCFSLLPCCCWRSCWSRRRWPPAGAMARPTPTMNGKQSGRRPGTGTARTPGRRRTDGLNPRAAGCRGASVPRPPRGLTLLALPPLYCQRPRSRPARRGRRTAARYCRPRRHRQARTRRPCSPYSTPLTAKYGIPVAGDRRRSQPRLRNRPGSYRPKKPHSHHQLRRRSWVLSEGTEAAWPQLENGLVLPRTAGDVLSRCNSPA